jgi:hypothetical protein
MKNLVFQQRDALLPYILDDSTDVKDNPNKEMKASC